MAMQSFQILFKLISIPLAMTCFLLLASQTGGFVLRTDNQTAETIVAIGSLR